jgi:hypothetical protein
MIVPLKADASNLRLLEVNLWSLLARVGGKLLLRKATEPGGTDFLVDFLAQTGPYKKLPVPGLLPAGSHKNK